MHTFQLTYRLFGIYILITLMNGCSWTPQVETPIYEGPQASVSLITVTEETFEADHPVALQTYTIGHILDGLHLRQNKRLLQKIFSNDNSSQPVFTEEQAKILTRQLQKAFSQVTPEEHVSFQTGGNQALDIQAIEGTMYVKGEDLYVSLTFKSQGAHSATKTAGRGVGPYQEGNGKPAVVFKPKEALRGEKKPHWLFGGDEKNHVVINIPLLASLHQQSTTPALQTGQEETKPPQISAPKSEATLPHKANETSSTRSTQQSQTLSDPTAENSDTKMLLEEIRALRKELTDQKKAIDRLKQEKPENR